MSGLLDSKTIVVTGGSTGIGRAAVERCAAAGAAVVIGDINLEAGEAAVAAAVEAGGRALFVPTDVTRSDQVEALIAAGAEAFGRIDGAFNNAGIEGGFRNILKLTEDAFDRTIAVNLKAVWVCVRAEIGHMVAHGHGGSIVNTASVAGLLGTRGGSAYCASKHGVVGLTKCTALEFARKNIRVNAVCPGVVDTPMLDRMVAESGLDPAGLAAQEPVNRLGQPREIADAVVWLLSEQASFCTGIAMPVDGGYSAQ